MKPRALFLLCSVLLAGQARAQTLDQDISGLAQKLSSSLVSAGFKNIAAIDFTDLQGRPTELGRYLSERLAVEIVMAGGVSMVDRANIKSILAEHKLTAEGLVNPANAKKLGEFAGVDVILIGNVTTLDGIELMVKAISTESARIVAAGRITFQKTSDVQWLLNRGISSSTSQSAPASGRPGNAVTYEESAAIATKDVGLLRIVLKSVLQTTTMDRYGRPQAGVTFSLELTNLDTRGAMVVAMNGDSDAKYARADSFLRASLVDDQRGTWSASFQALSGLGFVRAGVHGPDGQNTYHPSDIVKLLRLRDQLGRSDNDPTDGRADCAGFSVAYGAQRPAFCSYVGNRFISGATTAIEPGQTVSATLGFVRDASAGAAPSVLQFSGEFVIGVGGPTRTYSLQTVRFDQIGLQAR